LYIYIFSIQWQTTIKEERLAAVLLPMNTHLSIFTIEPL